MYWGFEQLWIDIKVNCRYIFGKYRKTYRHLKRKRRDIVRLARRTRPWDYGFMLEIEAEHLDYMADYFDSELSVAEDNKRCARICRIMRDCIYIASGYTWLGDKYINTRNKERFMTDDALHVYDDKKMEGKEEFCRDMLEDAYQIKAFRLYNKMRSCYMMELCG